MAIEIEDGQLRGFMEWLTGEKFPGLDETKLSHLSDSHVAVAQGLGEVMPVLAAAVQEISSGMEGKTKQAYLDAMNEYVSNDGYLPAAAKYVRRVGDDLKDAAGMVEYVKLMIIATLVELLAEFSFALMVAWFFPSILSQLAARLLVGRLVILQWVANIMVSVTSAMTVGIGMQVLMDAIVQLIQLKEGTMAWNSRLSLDAVKVGAWSSAFGLGLGAVGGTLLRGLGRPAGRHIPGSHLLGEIMHEAGTEVGADVTYSATQGKTISPGSIPTNAFSGAISGLAEGFGGKAGRHLNTKYGGLTYGDRPPPHEEKSPDKVPPAPLPVDPVPPPYEPPPAYRPPSPDPTVGGSGRWAGTVLTGPATVVPPGRQSASDAPTPVLSMPVLSMPVLSTPVLSTPVLSTPAGRLPVDVVRGGSVPVEPAAGRLDRSGPQSTVPSLPGNLGSGGPGPVGSHPVDPAGPAPAGTGPGSTGPARIDSVLGRATTANPSGVESVPTSPTPPDPLGTRPSLIDASRIDAVHVEPVHVEPVHVEPLTGSGRLPGVGETTAGNLDVGEPARGVGVDHRLAPNGGVGDGGSVRAVGSDPAPPASPRPESGPGAKVAEDPTPPTRSAAPVEGGVHRWVEPVADAHPGVRVLGPTPGGHQVTVDETSGPWPAVADHVPGPGRFTGGHDQDGWAVHARQEQLSAAGTDWVHGSDGWYAARRDGVLAAGVDVNGHELSVDVPAGSKAVFDGTGELKLVVTPDGVSHDRGLDGRWSRPRAEPGEIRLEKLRDGVRLALAGGKTAVLQPGGEVVRDQVTGDPVAYRGKVTVDGVELGSHTFVKAEADGWTQTRSAVRAVEFEAWLAGANGAHEVARLLYDVAARSDLGAISDTALRDMLLRGMPDDAMAAIYEAVYRAKGVNLRWTQIAAADAFGEGKFVQMAAGEGKSWVYFVDAVRAAARDGGQAVQVITTRANLADREFDRFSTHLEPFGFQVVRMNPDQAVAPVPGTPTIYVGTHQDVGFGELKGNTIPGKIASIDEVDEALRYGNANATLILSEGVRAPASPQIAAPVHWARDFLTSHLDSGQLGPADFGREPNQRGGRAGLTGAGQRTVEDLLERALTEAERKNLDMAATAHWEYQENIHYVVHGGSIYIIDQTTHDVLYDPETSTESRWNGGLAQAVEAKHGLAIRNDPKTSKSISVKELYNGDRYDRVTGASGTAAGHGQFFHDELKLSGQVEEIQRYYTSQLVAAGDRVSPQLGAKLTDIANDTQQMQQPGGSRQPQLILAHRNDLVAQVSTLLTERGVEHEVIDAHKILGWGVHRAEAFKEVIDRAGDLGKVLVINMQGARGVDIELSAAAKQHGGLHVRITARSGMSRDIDIQAENRAARSGEPGSVQYYISPDDDLFQLADNENVQHAIVRYENAANAAETASPLDALAELERRGARGPRPGTSPAGRRRRADGYAPAQPAQRSTRAERRARTAGGHRRSSARPSAARTAHEPHTPVGPGRPARPGVTRVHIGLLDPGDGAPACRDRRVGRGLRAARLGRLRADARAPDQCVAGRGPRWRWCR